MRPRNQLWICTLVFVLMTVAVSPGNGQQAPGAPAPPAAEYKMTTPIPPGIACPDKVETHVGTLNFFDGVPDQASAEKLYDNLDFQRAVQAYLLGLPVSEPVGQPQGSPRSRAGQCDRAYL